MKTIKSCILLSVILLVFSCKKFLEEKPTSFLTPDSQVSSVKVARAYTNACYEYLQGLNTGSGGYGGNTWELMEFMTGKASSDLGQTGYLSFQKLIYNNTSFYVDTWWEQMYLGIGSCNEAIAQIPKITAPGLSDQQKINMVAEARALRALYYFYLVRMYGAVPKVTELATDITKLNLPRTPAKNIYDSIIIPDLLLAEKSTLSWQDNSGLVSMGAIKSILSDVYLTYAGQAIKGGDTYYAESAKRSLDVIKNGGYSLFDDYTDMIKPANKNLKEFILQVQFAAAVPSTNPLTSLTVPNYSGISGYADEYGSVYPTDEFIQSYDPKDKRVAEKQFFYTSYKKYNKDNAADTPMVYFHYHYIYKWFDSLAVRNTLKSDVNYTIYRLAEVMLMYAEASNRAEGGPNADAIAYVNAIRQRANLAPIGALSRDAFEKEVWLQRYYELCFENKMWFDMLRTLKVHNDITGNWDDFVGHKTIFGSTFQEKQRLFPVPKQESDVNPNVLPNNTGF